MAFLRVRGESVSLLHGVRDKDHGVRHVRLHTFPRGVAELQSDPLWPVLRQPAHPGAPVARPGSGRRPAAR